MLLSVVGCTLLAALPLLARTHAQPVAGLRVINNSALEIRHLYFSPPDRDDWGPNQLGNSVIRPGESFTLDNVSCTQTEIKLVAEDQNGCFVSQVVACTDGAAWTIPAGVTPNCGN
ncbi:MAG TPA: hypothetical protein VF525_08985 [Pyrinomonadaceae bacterium]